MAAQCSATSLTSVPRLLAHLAGSRDVASGRTAQKIYYLLLYEIVGLVSVGDAIIVLYSYCRFNYLLPIRSCNIVAYFVIILSSKGSLLNEVIECLPVVV